ncbi:MAG: mannose-6-phosphate isomerase [Bacteriovoracaceae bacterium]|nr:mannose-6-phosphate isomerase [Bacteriovoracaceae bacterium]
MIIHLDPSIKRTIWGGTKLALYKDLPTLDGLDPIGETWEVSIHPEGVSQNGGVNLDLSPHQLKLPYLVKLIDTGKELSIQVHPGDEYAMKVEKSTGKSECWYIIDAKNEAGIYLGLKPEVTKESFISALKNNEMMNNFLNFYPVKAGDFFFVPAGSIHAIGAGITLAEVQQNSGITYRVWDWNRVDKNGKSRELHIEKSLDVINFDQASNGVEFFKKTNVLNRQDPVTILLEHKCFKLSHVNLNKGVSLNLSVGDKDRFPSILNLAGELLINGELVKKFSSVLIKDETNLEIRASIDSQFLLVE